jgi:signal transduction histidine kinase
MLIWFPVNICGHLRRSGAKHAGCVRKSRGTGGIGLGLSLAKRFVEAHGGSIRLQSKPDEGTSVSITLPIAEEDEA